MISVNFSKFESSYANLRHFADALRRTDDMTGHIGKSLYNCILSAAVFRFVSMWKACKR